MNTPTGRAAKRPLKNVSVQQLETAIAAALFKITAEKYHVDIRRFDLDMSDEEKAHDGAVIELRAIACEVPPRPALAPVAECAGTSTGVAVCGDTAQG